MGCVSNLGMMARSGGRLIAAAALAASVLVGAAARAQPAAGAAAAIPLELNKLEPAAQGGPGCLFYFLVTNPDSDPFEQLRLDLILFGKDGVIASRFGFDLGPLPPKKQAVRLFQAPGLSCDDVGKVLINDVIACTRKPGATPGTEAERAECLDRLAPTSRAKAVYTK